MVEYLWSNITETPSEGCQRRPRGLEVFGTVYMGSWDLSREWANQGRTYMPKSAITISDEWSLVRNKMFSGLSVMCHDKKGGVNKLETTYLRSRWTMWWSCRYFTPDNTDLRTATASRSEK